MLHHCSKKGDKNELQSGNKTNTQVNLSTTTNQSRCAKDWSSAEAETDQAFQTKTAPYWGFKKLINHRGEQILVHSVNEACVVICRSQKAQGCTNKALFQHPHCTRRCTASESSDTRLWQKRGGQNHRQDCPTHFDSTSPQTANCDSTLWLRVTPRGSLAPRAHRQS